MRRIGRTREHRESVMTARVQGPSNLHQQAGVRPSRQYSTLQQFRTSATGIISLKVITGFMSSCVTRSPTFAASLLRGGIDCTKAMPLSFTCESKKPRPLLAKSPTVFETNTHKKMGSTYLHGRCFLATNYLLVRDKFPRMYNAE